MKMKEYRISDLFEIVEVQKIQGEANDFQTMKDETHTIPLLTSAGNNQGFSGYAAKKDCPTILQNVITIASGGCVGATFYQAEPFAILHGAYAIRLKTHKMTEAIGLYLTAAIRKAIYGDARHWMYMTRWDNIKDCVITLPTTRNRKPDWQYMQEYISKLKQERITELEQFLITTKLGENGAMMKRNVFIAYSHQHRDMMLDVKDFISEELGFEVKTLDISEATGNIWDAFSKRAEECSKAVVLMSDDDFVRDSGGKEYKQARPNVFIELGYMIHKCGLKNVTIICSQECAMPSDIGGLIYVSYKEEKWTEKLRKQLNR